MSDEPRGDTPRPDAPEPEHATHLRAILQQEALLRAADAEPRELPTPLLARVPVVVIVGLLFFTVVAHNVREWTPDPEPQPAEVLERTGQVSVLVAGQRIEAFRRSEGRLPRTLPEAGLPEDRFVYRADEEEFELRLADAGADAPSYSSETGPGAVLRELAEPLDGEEEDS